MPDAFELSLSLSLSLWSGWSGCVSYRPSWQVRLQFDVLQVNRRVGETNCDESGAGQVHEAEEAAGDVAADLQQFLLGAVDATKQVGRVISSNFHDRNKVARLRKTRGLENMKLGNAARGTNPLDPVYKLPSCKDLPHFEPKFLRDNLNVDDILGAQPKKRVRFFTDPVRSGEVIEGSFPGWRPFHRRRFGKAVRDLCLQVHDINKPVRRMVRNGNSEAYLEIEGTHPKHLKQFDGDGVRHNHSLQVDDIKRKKREGIETSHEGKSYLLQSTRMKSPSLLLL